MDTFLKADIFFVITSVVVVLIGAFTAIILYYVLQIIKDMRSLTRTVKTEGERLVEDVSTARKTVRKKVQDIDLNPIALIASLVPKAKKTRRRKK